MFAAVQIAAVQILAQHKGCCFDAIDPKLSVNRSLFPLPVAFYTQRGEGQGEGQRLAQAS
jgi:hypothetical protein